MHFKTLNSRANRLGINTRRYHDTPEMIYAVVESLLFCGPDVQPLFIVVTERE